MACHFYLNDEEIRTDAAPGLLVLDFVRQRGHVGTKEGCREGDCGACVILVGTLEGAQVVYRPVTSCLMPLGEAHGKHLVTIEGLNNAELSPVQQAIVEEGATQCGFCTPGIVVSLTGLLMEDETPLDQESVKYALSGHLCRCTGYRSLKAAAPHLQAAVGTRTGVAALVEQGFLPRYFLAMPERLQRLASAPPRNGQAAPKFFVAGGTDLYVQQGEMLPESSVGILNLRPEMRGITKRDQTLHVGALTTFEDFANHPAVQRLIPEIQDYMFLIASWQIRNRATLGGNLVNASPIGDMTVLLLALQAEIVLRDGEATRTLPLTEFYLGYKKLARDPSEILTEILIREPKSQTRINWEKVSKRQCLDIATVNSALQIRCEAGTIREASLAMGGVAPVPLFMRRTNAFLREKPLTTETVAAALDVAQSEVAPISDVRGSAAYKRLLVRQLLLAHFTRLYPDEIDVRAFYEPSAA